MLANKKVLFVVAPVNFRDEEYFEPKEILSKAGIEIITASTIKGELKGIYGKKTKSNITLKDVKINDYDAIAFIGGGGAKIYWNDAIAHKIANEANSGGKIIGAICIAPLTLGKAGILAGKNVTAFPSVKNQLIECKANFTGKPVERDGDIITASGPEHAKEFAQALLDAILK